MQALLDRFSFGLLSLDPAARVLSVNAAARRIVAARDALEVLNGVLRAVRVSDDLQLRALLDAARARGAIAPVAQATLALARTAGGPSYLLYAVAEAPPPAPAAVSLLIIDPQQAPWPTVATLMQVFALTQVEAELAIALAGGETLAVHARQCGMSVATARRHLDRALRKAQVGHAADLVRATLALTLPLAAAAPVPRATSGAGVTRDG